MNFQVKDSGERYVTLTGMQRDTNKGKMRPDLCIPLDCKNPMFIRWAIHMAEGAKKYGERNCEKARTADEYYRFKESAFRHFLQWLIGEEDEDHASAVYFNIQGAEYTKERMEQEQLNDSDRGTARLV